MGECIFYHKALFRAQRTSVRCESQRKTTGEHNHTNADDSIELQKWHTLSPVIRGSTATVQVDELNPITLNSMGWIAKSTPWS